MPLIQYGQFESIVEPMTRITEGSDTRITESGDIRLTNDEISNTVRASLVAEGTVLSLYKEVYVKVSGVWKRATPYVKYNGTWQEPTKIYVKESVNWRRVY